MGLRHGRPLRGPKHESLLWRVCFSEAVNFSLSNFCVLVIFGQSQNLTSKHFIVQSIVYTLVAGNVKIYFHQIFEKKCKNDGPKIPTLRCLNCHSSPSIVSLSGHNYSLVQRGPSLHLQGRHVHIASQVCGWARYTRPSRRQKEALHQPGAIGSRWRHSVLRAPTASHVPERGEPV